MGQITADDLGKSQNILAQQNLRNKIHGQNISSPHRLILIQHLLILIQHLLTLIQHLKFNLDTIIMNAIQYSPSTSHSSWEVYQSRNEDRQDQLQALQDLKSLVQCRDFKERLIIFLDDLTVSAPEATLSDLPYPYQIYFLPAEIQVLSQISSPDPRSRTKEVLEAFSQVSRFLYHLVQRYRHPENITSYMMDENEPNAQKLDQKFRKCMAYLRRFRKCIPGTLIWEHEDEYQVEERIQMEKEEKLKESRQRAAVKRKETMARKKLLAQSGEGNGTDNSASSETTPSVVAQTSATGTSSGSDESTPPTENSTVPENPTPVVKEKQTRKRKRVEKDVVDDVKSADVEKRDDETCKPADSSDGPSVVKRLKLTLKSPEEPKETLKSKTGRRKAKTSL